MANSAERVYELIKDAVEAEGVRLWDVRFLKEGASWYLRVFIDKPEGISIDDCTNVSHAIDPIIDEADPIDVSYYLEVCSPGIERELTRSRHYEESLGKQVRLKLYRAYDGKKEITGTLEDVTEENVTLVTEGNALTLERKAQLLTGHHSIAPAFRLHRIPLFHTALN